MPRILCLIVMAVFGFGPAASAQSPTAEDPRLVAALFRSNWCGPCKILEPRYERVMAEYAQAPLEQVRFDSSFGRRSALAERASEEGIRPAYDAVSDATGFVLLIDRDTGDVLARITMAYSEADIAGALDYALDLIADRERFGL
ncbi:thioredoxin domain-containing protein [Oceanicaulis sp. LC35]|uniref:thioredoxin domain-containing protein n=1 Tax=Oceanicaulis sp. LC35 TaxID=3349635 RepID=UPI003F84DEB4